MYTPGKLIYFDPFHFGDGSPSKPKFFLVLKVYDGNALLACMPSSKKHLPSNQAIIHGCLEVPDSGINCYICLANKSITKSGWSFQEDTMLYGNWIGDYSIESLKSVYTIEKVEYEIIGDFDDEEFKKIIDCFRNSAVVKNRYRRILAQ